MGVFNNYVTVYTCDQCSKIEEVESRTGLTPPWPTNWLSIQPSAAEHDMFCSWTCIATFCTNRAAAAEQRAQFREEKGTV